MMLTGRASCFVRRAGVFKVAMVLLMALLAVGLTAQRAAVQEVIHMDVFVNSWGTIYHNWTLDGATWSGWYPLQVAPDEILSVPTAVAMGWGREDLFVMCGNYNICHNWYDESTGRDWGEWEVFAGPGPMLYGIGQIAVSVIPGNRSANVFVVSDNFGADHYVYHGVYTRDGGLTWDAQRLRSGPVGEYSGVGAGRTFYSRGQYWTRLNAFGKSSKSFEYLTQWWTSANGAWGWTAHPELSAQGEPEQTPDSVDARFVLVTPPGEDDRYLWIDEGTYLPPGAVSDYKIGAVSPAPGRIDVFAAPSREGGVYYTTHTNGAWSDWKEIPGLDRYADMSSTDVVSWTAP